MLAVVFSGSAHYAAHAGTNGVAAAIAEPETQRTARTNDVVIEIDRVWIGASARRAELAGVRGESYSFRAEHLTDFGSLAVGRQIPPGLSSECVLALLLRGVMLDAKHAGHRTQQIVVALDYSEDEASPAAGRLEQFLSEVLSVRVRIVRFESAIECFLSRRGEDSGACGLLAVDDHAWVARMREGQFKVMRIAACAGLRPLREAVQAQAAEGATTPSWSRHRVWREFVAWHASTGRTPDAPAFLPHLIDRRFRRQAISPGTAHGVSRAVFASAVAGALAAMDELPPGAELLLIGDDAIDLGLRNTIEPRRQDSLRIRAHGFVRIAAALAETYRTDLAPLKTEESYGVLIRDTGDAPKRLHVLVAAGSQLPTEASLLLSGLSGKQRRFKVDLAAQRGHHAPRLLRHVYFECGSEVVVNQIRLTLRADADHRITLEAVDSDRMEPLLVAESEIPLRDGSMAPGPDAVARLAFAGGTL
jgi:hypothetical protein